MIAALSAKLFPKEQIPTEVPKGLDLLGEDVAEEVLEDIAEERAAGIGPGPGEEDPFEAFGGTSRLLDETGIDDIVAREFETEEEQIGGPATAQEAPQDPASVLDQNTRSLEDILEVAVEIARTGVPVKDEVKTIAAGSIL